MMLAAIEKYEARCKNDGGASGATELKCATDFTDRAGKH